MFHPLPTIKKKKRKEKEKTLAAGSKDANKRGLSPIPDGSVNCLYFGESSLAILI